MLNFLSKIIDDVEIDTRFLGCIRPNSNILEYWISEMSPSKYYVKLYQSEPNVYFWVGAEDVAVFEIL